MDGCIFTEQKTRLLNQHKNHFSPPETPKTTVLWPVWGTKDFSSPLKSNQELLTKEPKFSRWQLILFIHVLENTIFHNPANQSHFVEVLHLLQVEHERQTVHSQEIHSWKPLFTQATEMRQLSQLKEF